MRNGERDMDKIRIIEEEFTKKEVPKFNVGDTVKIMVKIPEGPDKTRLHPFEGVVISKKGSGIRQSFTVRKVSFAPGASSIAPSVPSTPGWRRCPRKSPGSNSKDFLRSRSSPSRSTPSKSPPDSRTSSSPARCSRFRAGPACFGSLKPTPNG